MLYSLVFLLILSTVKADGVDCVQDGKIYKAGAPVPASDCNRCACSNGQVLCTMMICPPVLKRKACVFNGVEYGDGQAMPPKECNNCYCTNGQKMCTQKVCL